MLTLFCFTASWIVIAVAAWREPTMTKDDKEKNHRIIYTILIAEMATAYAIFATPTLSGKIAVAIIFEIATLDFWVLSKLARARQVLVILRKQGWPAFKTVDFLRIPTRKGVRRVTIPVKKVGKYADRLVYFARALAVVAMVIRFIFVFPNVSNGMVEFCYAIIVMSVAGAIAMVCESDMAKVLETEVRHRLNMVRRKNPYALDLTPQQYEFARMMCFRDCAVGVMKHMFLILLATSFILGVIYWGIGQLTVIAI